MFKNISIGTHEEALRKMILNRNPGRDDDYPCMIRSCLNSNKVPEDFIGQPHQTAGNPETPITCYIGGMFYRYYLSKIEMTGFDSSEAISQDGALKILHMPDEECIKYFEHFTGFKVT